MNNPDISDSSAQKNRTKLIRQASIIALAGNLVLAVGKIITGIFADSLAVLGDGIDSSTDVVIALVSLVVSVIIARPADEDHPWGHYRAETMATTTLSFILFFCGAQLILNSLQDLLSGNRAQLPEMPALIMTLISIVGKTALAFSQYHLGKKAESSMLKANGINMRNDIIISSGVMIGLLIAVIGKIPMADTITAILVGLWVLRSSIGIFREVNLELMDGTSDKEGYREVFEAALSVPGVQCPHRARMRKIASYWDIDLDIEVDPTLSVLEAHKIAMQVEDAIKNRVKDVYDIMIHVEPANLGEHTNEGFGLNVNSLK